MRSRKSFVFENNRSRKAEVSVTKSKTFNDAATIAGATEFENRYGRERCRSNAMISFRPLV